MTLKTALASDLSVFFNTDQFADSITYGGASVDAIIQYGDGKDGASARTATIQVKVSDVADPGYRDVVVINSVTWRVFKDVKQEQSISGDGYIWEIPIIRDERPII